MSQKIAIGSVADFPEGKGKEITIKNQKYAVYRSEGKLGCIGNQCLHSGGPLGKGEVKNGRVFCPWHNWDWDFKTGQGFGEESVGGYKIWEEDGQVYVDPTTPTMKRKVAPAHDKLVIVPRKFKDKKIRILGISTTNMNKDQPRSSTSEFVLESALKKFSDPKKFETKVLKLRDLNFAECEGFYSKDKGACIWPCSIAQANHKDGMVEVYQGLVEWCDIVVVTTPIRWGCASSLYYKMQERLNCIQNQITLNNRILINQKNACFIITGGQDNVQSVAGQMLMFFSELGFTFGQFPFVGWSRGWTNEEMDTNFSAATASSLIDNAAEMIEFSVAGIENYRLAGEGKRK